VLRFKSRKDRRQPDRRTFVHHNMSVGDEASNRWMFRCFINSTQKIHRIAERCDLDGRIESAEISDHCVTRGDQNVSIDWLLIRPRFVELGIHLNYVNSSLEASNQIVLWIWLVKVREQ